jgi:thiol:disulfide interchange protein DsbD
MSRRSAILQAWAVAAGLAATATLAGPPAEDQLPFASAPAGASAATADFSTQTPVRLRTSGPQEPLAPGADALIEVEFLIADQAYVNQEMTRVKLEPAEGLVLGEPLFPEPLTKEVPSLGKVAKIYKDSFKVQVPVRVEPGAAAGERELVLSVRYQACNDHVCFIPKTEKSTVRIQVDAGIRPILPVSAALPAAAPQSDFAGQVERGLAYAYLFAFLFGLASSLTPCVYPMIPITIAVIGAKKSRSRAQSFLLSLVFVLGIATVYSAFGVSAAATGSLFGAALQSRLVLRLVALMFAALGLGMMGFYDLTVPAPIAARLNRMGGQGYVGAFLVGMATGVVASPCVGPLFAGLLGWVATTQNLALGFTLMFVFALGLGMLFLVVGTFSSVLMSLPRSGAWMIRVKHLLGATLFAAAWYYALPVLPVWFPAALLAPGLLLLASGELQGHRERKFAVAWMAAASTYLLLLGAGAIWPGWISTGFTSTAAIQRSADSAVRWIPSEPQGLERAASERKPVMIDFYADWCVACKELDLFTYSDPQVARVLEGFISIKLDGTNEEEPGFQAAFRKYGVLSLPTVVFLTPEGRVVPELTLSGFEGPADFLKRLDAARQAR